MFLTLKSYNHAEGIDVLRNITLQNHTVECVAALRHIEIVIPMPKTLEMWGTFKVDNHIAEYIEVLKNIKYYNHIAKNVGILNLEETFENKYYFWTIFDSITVGGTFKLYI